MPGSRKWESLESVTGMQQGMQHLWLLHPSQTSLLQVGVCNRLGESLGANPIFRLPVGTFGTTDPWHGCSRR